MLTNSSTELRSASPSLIMRAVKWVMARSTPVFPHDAAGFHAGMAGRKLRRMRRSRPRSAASFRWMTGRLRGIRW